MRTITFIVPVRSPEYSSDFGVVSALCLRTLGSLANQTSDSWHCVLVCHEPPHGLKPSRDVTVVADDFPVPTSHYEGMQDKGYKKARGLAEIAPGSSRYVMALDSDDLLHHRFVEFLDSCPVGPGWIVDSGFEYGHGRWAKRVIRGFHRRCGSCLVLNGKETKADDTAFMMDHSLVDSYYRANGVPLRRLPFYAAVCILETGQNAAGWRPVMQAATLRSRLGLLRRLRPVTKGFQRRFNLTPLQDMHSSV